MPIKRRKLMDLYGSLPVTKRWPGKKRARDLIGRKLGAELARKAKGP